MNEEEPDMAGTWAEKWERPGWYLSILVKLQNLRCDLEAHEQDDWGRTKKRGLIG